MDIKLIDQLYLKLESEYKTKRQVYERIKRELVLVVKIDSIKKAHERYLKKKETGQDKETRQEKDRTDRTTGQDKKTKVQTEIILNENRKSDKEIMRENDIPQATYYRYKKKIRQHLTERSERLLREALEFAYPDELEILKRVKGKKRNILIKSIEEIEKNITSKDEQIALHRAISNIKAIEREIMEDVQVIGIDKQAEYEKQLVRENIDINRFELDKEKVNGKDEGDMAIVLMKLKKGGVSSLSDEELKILEEFLTNEDDKLTSEN